MGKVKAKTKISESADTNVDSKDESKMLTNVLELGGQKADLLLIDVDDDQEEILMDEADELDAEPINRDDIMEFIQQLKIKNYRDPSFSKPEKASKSKGESKKTTENVEDAAPRASISSENKKEKKKKGNRYKVQHDEVSSTVMDVEHENKSRSVSEVENLDLTYKGRKYLLMKTGFDWIEQSFASDPTKFDPVNERTLEKLRQYAQRLYEGEVVLYQERKKSDKSNAAWMKTVVSSGTLGDKVAALTVMIQDAVVYSIQQLDQLLAMLKKKGKRESFMALDNLKELFLTVWLPDNRKLRKFEEHPLSQLSDLSSGNKDSRDRRLLIWYYEDLLKDKYSDFVSALESLAHDQLQAAKGKTITTVYDLLVAKPEQEKRLLMVLVNKLGDPDQKIAAKCTHRLINLLEKHPNMNLVVTLEVERLLYRPNISKKAQYYAVCFLNQMILSHAEAELASRLISVYFSFFKGFVKKGEVDSRMMSALLSGVNRAYPYAKDDKAKLEENMNTLYQVVHVVNFNTSIQALMLIYQVMDSSASVSDRYYTSLYRKLVDPNLAHSSKQAMFLNLLFKTMKKDSSAKRVKAFIKRLLQVSSSRSHTFACSTLILVAEVLKAHPEILDLSHAAEESDDEEHFVDVPDEGDEPEEQVSKRKSESQVMPSSWVHKTNLSTGKEKSDHYDPHHRNPLYTCADRECVWELKKMSRHFHPTVAMFANNILEGKPIEYPGDPLSDFSLIRFLDRFVYRNPKKKDEVRSAQAKQERTPVGARAIPVNSAEYLTQGEARIPVDENFFFRYFIRRAKLKETKSRDLEDEDSDVESVDDDEFDHYLAKHESNFEGDEKVSFDFANEFSNKKTTKKGKKTNEEENDDSAEDLSDEEVDLGELDFDDDNDAGDSDEMGDVDFDEDEDEIDDEDEDAIDDEDEDSDDEDDIFSHGKKLKTAVSKKTGGSRKRKDDITSLFASAEEFSHLLEKDADSRVDMSGSQALSNVKDKASMKQLKWEADRDRWLRGVDWRSKKISRSAARRGNSQKHKGKKKKKTR